MGYYYQDPKTGSTWWVDDNQTAAQADPWQGTGAAGNTYGGAQQTPVTVPPAPQPTTLNKQQQQDVGSNLASGNYSQNAALQAAQEFQNSGAAVPTGAQYSTPNANGGLTMAPLPVTVPPQKTTTPTSNTPLSATPTNGAGSTPPPGFVSANMGDWFQNPTTGQYWSQSQGYIDSSVMKNLTPLSGSVPTTSLATGATPHSMVATPGTRSQIPDVTSQEVAGQPRSIASTVGSIVNSPALIPGLDAAGLIAADNGIGGAQDALVAGGNQAVDTIQQGATAAQGTLASSLNTATGELNDIKQQNQTALDPYQAAGKTGLTSLENTQPFAFNPTDLTNDPGYQFRLQEGEKAIQNAASAGGGSSLSGATLKGLDKYAAGEASQEFQNAYNRGLSTYQENLAVPTQLSNLGANATATGVNANTNVGNMIAQITNQYGTSVAGIQTGTANAVANIQTQIASAVAAGDIARANALTQTMSQLAAWAQSQQTLAALKQQPPNTNTNTNTININGQPVTLPDTSKNPLPPPVIDKLPPNPPPVTTGPPPVTTGNPTGTATTTATSTNPDGSTTTFNPNGGTTTKNPDGSTTTVNPDGSKVFTDPSGHPINVGAAPIDTSNGANPETGMIPAGTTLANGNPASTATTASAGTAAAGGLTSLAEGGTAAAGALPSMASIAAGIDASAVPDIGAGLAAAGGEAGAGTAAAGSTAAGGSGVMSAIGGFLTNPITIGIGAALAAGFGLYEAFKSTTHEKASDLVTKFQDPLVNDKGTGALNQVVDQFNSARQQGTLTVSQANAALDQTKSLINNWDKTIADWKAKGGDYATVANQAEKTMAGYYGPDFSNLLGSMQTNIDQRQGVIDDPAQAA